MLITFSLLLIIASFLFGKFVYAHDFLFCVTFIQKNSRLIYCQAAVFFAVFELCCLQCSFNFIHFAAELFVCVEQI